VQDVAVVGVPSEQWGETPVAFVVSEGVSAEEIKTFVNERVGKTQRLADVRLSPEPPRSHIGKVLKRELRDSYSRRPDATAQKPLTDEQQLVRMNASLLLGARLVQLDSKRGHARIAFEAKQESCNSMGNIQGGFVAAMLDEAVSLAAIAHAQRRIGLPTPEFKVT
jgi:hypothetical protein